ncbi:ABC transporter permease [Nocardioides sp. R-C-SC26]|uniref:ABC transporter permease n=1 Tax=Nocardioides sp. R-C-SC26 TaxID=2870414 RepID=UPI001E312343|nr:ABC transporter permease [Nocardioides sp. R-C-SC26]
MSAIGPAAFPPPPPGFPAAPGGQPGAAMPPGYLDVSRTAQTPFWRLVGVELRKAVDTVASFWLVMSVAILVVIVDGFVLLATLIQSLSVSFDDFSAVAAGVTSLILPVLGIMLVTSEWSQRTAMVTFALEPRRIRVVWAKLVVGLLLTVIAVLFALVVGLGCTLICEIFNGENTSWNLQLDAMLGFLLSQMLAMLGGFALATLLLNTPAAIVLFFVYRYMVPLVLFVVAGLWRAFEDISPYLNFVEAQGPLAELSMNGEEFAQLLVSGAIWLVLPLVLGIARILRAEVK